MINAESIASVVAASGCDRVFGLMGDGNMHLVLALEAAGIGVVEVRHESAAVTMAEGYGWSSGRVGVCSVTHGPGLSHTATSLLVAARNGSPLVLLAGETPAGYAGAQLFDQRRLVEACEAPYRVVGPDDDAGAVVRAAIAEAATWRRPVVVGVPADLLGAVAGPRRPEAIEPPPWNDLAPDVSAAAAAALAVELAAAERIVLLAGRGVLVADCAAKVVELAERLGAGLATTLPAKGLFDGHALDLGIAGGLSHPEAEPVFAHADLVVALGASAGASTTRSGLLWPEARLVKIDRRPGCSTSGPVHLQGELSAVLVEAVERVPRGPRQRWFDPCAPWPRMWDAELAGFRPVLAPGTVDPRRAMIDLDRELPEDALVVIANGHCSGFASALLRTAAPRELYLAQGFGSIGQGMTTALGVALGRPGRPVVVIEGDAGFMMHAHELDTVVRAGARLTVVVVNDEALGTEYHRLEAEQVEGGGSLAVLATPSIAAVAAAAGAVSVQVTDDVDVKTAVTRLRDARPGVLELRTSRSVESRHLRWRHLEGSSSVDAMERGVAHVG